MSRSTRHGRQKAALRTAFLPSQCSPRVGAISHRFPCAAPHAAYPTDYPFAPAMPTRHRRDATRHLPLGTPRSNGARPTPRNRQKWPWPRFWTAAMSGTNHSSLRHLFHKSDLQPTFHIQHLPACESEVGFGAIQYDVEKQTGLGRHRTQDVVRLTQRNQNVFNTVVEF